MTRRRPYVPKTKGCYQCSQRRIHCDRTQPSCGKCVSRGILCSGIDVRYRFCDGYGPRSTGKRISDASDALSSFYTRDASRDRERHWNNGGAGHDQPKPAGLRLHYALTWRNSHSWERFLVEHFSDNIAPEMVVIDDSHNGWRHLILPLAWMDELIMKAVLAVSAFHFSGKADGQVSYQELFNPITLYSKAIHELQNRRDLNQYDHQTKRLVILSIIVLLVAVMVTGCSDFPILFCLLQSALNTIGGENGLGPDELSEFALRQIYKMRVYAAPFISQQEGVSTILSQFQT